MLRQWRAMIKVWDLRQENLNDPEPDHEGIIGGLARGIMTPSVETV